MTEQEEKLFGEVGTYQICFKSGATAILEGVELLASFLPGDPPAWFFQRDGQRVSFTAHFISPNAGGQKPLDDVIDAILRLK